MAGLVAARPGLRAVRRVITRAAWAGGGDFEAASEAEFTRRALAQGLLLHRQAHGLRYGIPAGVAAQVAGGDMLANLSRGTLARAAALLPQVIALSLTARPETLAARLATPGARRGHRSGHAPVAPGFGPAPGDDGADHRH
jgi:ribose 1,5-bisphosphokinase